MTRSDIVRKIMADVKPDEIVVASTGYIAREVFKVKDRPLNFYVMGSMGAALGIGIGIAMSVKNRVYVINGDGSALMSLGTMLTHKSLNLHNLFHIIIDNGRHESTGGQRTVSGLIRFERLGPCMHYKAKKDSSIPPRITLTPSQITERFQNAIRPYCNKSF